MPVATKPKINTRGVPFYLSAPPQFIEGFGYWLKPGGFRPCDAIAYSPISTAYIREEMESLNGWKTITQTSGSWEKKNYSFSPPTREQCQIIAEVLNSRKDQEMELLDEAIANFDELTMTGKQDWRGNYRQKAMGHKAIKERVKDELVDGDILYAFFVEIHALQANARLDPNLQAAQAAQRDAEKWTEEASRARELVG